MLRIQTSKSTIWWTDWHWGGLRPSEHKLMVLWKKKTEYWVQKTMSFACNLSKLFQIFKSFSTKCHMSWSKLFLYRQKGLKKKEKHTRIKSFTHATGNSRRLSIFQSFLYKDCSPRLSLPNHFWCSMDNLNKHFLLVLFSLILPPGGNCSNLFWLSCTPEK